VSPVFTLFVTKRLLIEQAQTEIGNSPILIAVVLTPFGGQCGFLFIVGGSNSSPKLDFSKTSPPTSLAINSF
jgi:hypothetical protein